MRDGGEDSTGVISGLMRGSQFEGVRVGCAPTEGRAVFNRSAHSAVPGISVWRLGGMGSVRSGVSHRIGLLGQIGLIGWIGVFGWIFVLHCFFMFCFLINCLINIWLPGSLF